MSCTRESVQEVQDKAWNANYKNTTIKSQLCKHACISDLNCVAWKVDNTGICSLATELYENPPDLVVQQGTKSGLVKCSRTYNVWGTLMWLLIFFLIILVIYFVMNPKRIDYLNDFNFS